MKKVGFVKIKQIQTSHVWAQYQVFIDGVELSDVAEVHIEHISPKEFRFTVLELGSLNRVVFQASRYEIEHAEPSV